MGLKTVQRSGGEEGSGENEGELTLNFWHASDLRFWYLSVIYEFQVPLKQIIR